MCVWPCVCGVCVCVCVCTPVHVCVAMWLKHIDCQLKDHRFKSHPLGLEEKKSIFLHLAPNPGPSTIVNWVAGSGWGRTRPLAVLNSTELQVELWVPTPQWKACIVSAPASACRSSLHTCCTKKHYICNHVNKVGHLTVLLAQNSSPHLLLTPAQLMRPGIGQNTSCTR